MSTSETGTVASLGSRGEGVVRCEGKVVFVSGALPGERIRFTRFQEPGRFEHGRLDAILEPHPGRRPSPCPLDHPGGCGGCDLLGLEPRAAADVKAEVLRALLEHAGIAPRHLEPPRVIAGAARPACRNRARFQIVNGRPAYVGRPGAEHSGPRDLVPVGTCPVLHPLLDALLQELDGRLRGLRTLELRAGANTGERLAVLDGPALPPELDPVALDASILWRGPGGTTLLRGQPWLHEVVEGVTFRISAGSFFQPEAAGAAELVRLVGEMLPPLGPSTHALDLFAGVGLFSLTALARAGRLVAVESDGEAAEDFRVNARGAAPHATFLRLDATDHVQDLLATRDRPDVVVADPPRAGLGRRLVHALAALRPPTLVVVSCAPRNLARDLPPLLEAGYVLDRLVPVDQFGGTHHMEAVAALRLSHS